MCLLLLAPKLIGHEMENIWRMPREMQLKDLLLLVSL